ncbi:hypothetical protein [Rhizobium indicum]|uniref:Uncharacterized protein n=1 Tax=Rhizobium indicum TaxID=2583231 RepID=A0ABX6PSK4_9HYPH|nr:hypothetical protein [Rhizobium indicum]QKK21636.1 hypothetical protein FFM53_035160 [Rhizobium indicum]
MDKISDDLHKYANAAVAITEGGYLSSIYSSNPCLHLSRPRPDISAPQPVSKLKQLLGSVKAPIDKWENFPFKRPANLGVGRWNDLPLLENRSPSAM